MSFASRLDHVVHLERVVDAGSEDEWGQPVIGHDIGGPFNVAIQSKTAQEVALIEQSGAPSGTFTIFSLPRVIAAGDAIVHDTMVCPKADEIDLPTGRYELTGVRNAAGLGHHLEMDARLVGSTAGVEGS
jgi:hypothetical protein